PFFWILVFWLTVVFLTLGLAAPLNRIAAIGIVLCALSLTSAIFVITDLSRPYRGLMIISSDDMREALAHMLASPKYAALTRPTLLLQRCRRPALIQRSS